MLLEIHNENPQERNTQKVAEILSKGGIAIIPTDTIYAIVCDAFNQKATEKLCMIVGKKPEKANLSLLCKDLSEISVYTNSIQKEVFRLMKSCLPGPYTFILNGSHELPKLLKSKRKTIGIRIPDNKICCQIIENFGNPLIAASIHSEDDIIEYITDPLEIHEKYERQIDIVIDGGMGGLEPSTIIDCTGDSPVLLRAGKGEVNELE